jgi:hypothetical protein
MTSIKRLGQILVVFPLLMDGSLWAGVSLGLGKAAAERGSALAKMAVAATIESGEPSNSALTLTGPTGGAVGVQSSSFTVKAVVELTGSVTITPSDGNGGGLFAPTILTLSANTSTATFTYTPASSGSKTIAITNTGGLPNPAALTYTVSSVVVPDGITLYLTHDGDAVGSVSNTSAPNKAVWNIVLGFPWKRGYFGDWMDANQTPYGIDMTGAVPYASFAVPAPGVYSVSVTPLVQRWMANGKNRGFYLRMKNNAFNVRFAGRTDPVVEKRPKITVTTTNGTFSLPARCNATWSTSTYSSVSSALLWELAGGQPAILQFDLSGVSGTVTSATLHVTDTYHLPGSTMANGIVDVFEADPPGFTVPDVVTNPVTGIAASVQNFQALASHPDVLFSDDFGTPGSFDTGWDVPPTRAVNPTTNTTYAVGGFEAGRNGSSNIKKLVMRGANGYGGGGMDVQHNELYSQYFIYLEDDFGSTSDAVKIPAMGCQFGWWNTNSGGYWAPVTGNGGSPGTGLKVYNSGASRWDYQGHSVRLLLGQRPADNSAYADLFSVAIYPYNLDQTGPFPDSILFPYVAVKKRTWYAFDLHMKQNSMGGGQDASGNYATANADGVFEAWINGYPAFSKSNFRWRRHLEFGVEGFWLDFYHGGVAPAPYPMHYRVDRVTMATQYIGPPAPDAVVVSGDDWTPNVTESGAVVSTDFTSLPLNRWLYVKTNTISNVIGPTGYPTKLGNSDGRNSITNTWSGAGWDWINEIMFVSGGGHADSHMCENGIYAFDSETMRWQVAVPRSPMSDGLKQSAGGVFEPILDPSDPRQESANGPMADGHVGATHTYDTIDFVPPSVMGNTRGGIIMFAGSVHVYDLDTQTSDVPYYDSAIPNPVDLSYKISFVDGWKLFHARARYSYRHWDLSPHIRSNTEWSAYVGNGATSRGAFVKTINSGAEFIYSHKAMVKMWQRREVAVLSSSARIRVRYGQAVDAGIPDNWAAYSDTITLTSLDGSHLDFNEVDVFRDDNFAHTMYAAGFAYDPVDDCLWVTTNHVGGASYKITGLNGNTWTTQRVVGAANLTRALNGTYGRMQVTTRGGATCLIRVPSVPGYTEIMRVK